MLVPLLSLAPVPFLAPLFHDHMVMQRGKPNRIWGWDVPGQTVTVSMSGRVVRTKTTADGRWELMIQPPKVGGPYTVHVVGSQSVVLDDVLVGDVWLCSGQSNMEFGLTNVENGAAEAAKADHPQIRLFMVGRQVGYSPKTQLTGTWKVCTPTTVAQDGWGGFSAVGYYFGRKLHQDLKVPIGLIESSWGGTSAEAWASREGLAGLPDLAERFAPLDASKSRTDGVFGTFVNLWLANHDSGFSNGWYKPDAVENGWTDVSLPGEINNAPGVVWLRKEIELKSGDPAILRLGRIRDTDTIWVNGTLLGNTSFDWAWRTYAIPDGVLKPGKNVIAIRVFAPDGKAAFLNPANDLAIEQGGGRTELAGPWRMRPGFISAEAKDRPLGMDPNPTVPTTLYNGMIAPLAPFALKGAIWYQGETNAGRGYQYRLLLPAMIADWRRAFGQGDFPFYIVSLANFGKRATQPGDDGWAELREAQDLTARTIKNSGLAVTIDVGDADDIHPKDKRTVGERLALNALAQTYGRPVEYSGPTYRSMKVEGNRLRLRFAHAKGLQTRGGSLEGFAVAGSDRKWVWAKATIEGSDVVVKAPGVANPVAVRYAWAINPPATLYNAAGLPAVPFRTDDWPGVSINSN